MTKYIILLGDGMSDEQCDQLKGKTPGFFTKKSIFIMANSIKYTYRRIFELSKERILSTSEIETMLTNKWKHLVNNHTYCENCPYLRGTGNVA